MTAAEIAITLLVRSINAWLLATGQTWRVKATDIVVTRLETTDGRTRLIMAFEETPADGRAAAAPGRPYSTMGVTR